MIERIHLVPSSTGDGTTYEVDSDSPYCTCPAFRHRRGPCKHVLAVRAKPNRYTLKDEEGEKVSQITPDPAMFTVGHSNHSLDDFQCLLDTHGLTAVVDVRSRPYSRRQEHFHRFKLRDALREHGVDYFWVGKELGGLAKVAVNSAAFQQRMGAVLRMAKVHRVALMCSEGKPYECHRAYKLSAWVHRLPETERVPITHILRDGDTECSLELEAELPKSWLDQEFGGKGGA